MKRVDLLLAEVRQETDTTEFTSETGVQDSTIIRALNDAQTRIHSLIQQQAPATFQRVTELQLSAELDTYKLPADVFAGIMIEQVEVSTDGNPRNYRALEQGVLLERASGCNGDPTLWVRRSDELIVTPRPSSGSAKARITYVSALPALEKRRGLVSDLALDVATRKITNLVLDPTRLTPEDAQALMEAEFFCVVSQRGVIKVAGVPLADLNVATGQITVGEFTLAAGDGLAVGDFVVAGAYATTHSQLPDVAERYLLAFGKWRVQKRDSSNDSQEGFAEKTEMEADIVSTFSERTKGVTLVPIIDTQFLEY